MKKKLFILILFVLGSIKLFSIPSNGFIKVYLDCHRCDDNYIKQNISFTQFVNNRFSADFHVMVNEERTGGGGEKYQIMLLGRGQYSGIQDTLNFKTYSNQSSDKTRIDLVKNIKAGLIKYAVDANLIESISVDPIQEKKPVKNGDKWNKWVFEIDLDGDYEEEKSNIKENIGIRLEARRITKEWKIDNNIRYNYEQSKYITDSATIIGIQREANFNGRIVKSISSHWSVGTKYRAENSSYSNLDFAYILGPAIEYNIFPYHQSTNKLFTLNYGVGYKYNNYIDQTIFGKMQESFAVQLLTSELRVTKPWGEIDINIETQTFIPDFDYNHFTLWGRVDFNLFRGFSLFGWGSISRIHDQVALRLEEGSTEDVLLEVSEQATDYSMDFRIGLNYTFGSIYNDVVNPRF